MKYPTYVKNCIEMLEKSGYSAYAVGGAVRDSLLGLEPSDWDVTTSALPKETQRVFADFRTIPTGIKHGTITVLFDENGTQHPVEITTFRVDGEYRDSRHPENVSFSRNLCDDLSRRDFTINAMAFNEKEGIIDVFGGQNDLENRVIRAVGDPQKRFTEDALRILRAFRFSAQLGFEIEPQTLDGAHSCAHLLKNIARERVGAEFKKLLASVGVVYSLEKMIDIGVWRELFEGFVPRAEVVSALSKLDNGNFATRLSVLIADCDDGKICEILNSLRLSNSEKKLVIRLCSIKNFSVFDDNITRRARNFLHYYHDILSLATEVLLFYSNSADFVQAVLEESSKNRPLSISDLDIRGEDVLELCDKDYSKVGEILKYLLHRVIDDPSLNQKEKLIEIVKKSL